MHSSANDSTYFFQIFFFNSDFFPLNYISGEYLFGWLDFLGSFYLVCNVFEVSFRFFAHSIGLFLSIEFHFLYLILSSSLANAIKSFNIFFLVFSLFFVFIKGLEKSEKFLLSMGVCLVSRSFRLNEFIAVIKSIKIFSLFLIFGLK